MKVVQITPLNPPLVRGDAKHVPSLEVGDTNAGAKRGPHG